MFFKGVFAWSVLDLLIRAVLKPAALGCLVHSLSRSTNILRSDLIMRPL